MDPEITTPLPVPMEKEKTVKEDGRFLYYYTFPPEAPQPTTGADAEQNTEKADV